MSTKDGTFLTRKVTKLVGNTSFRTEFYKTKAGRFATIKVKDVAPNPHVREGIDND